MLNTALQVISTITLLLIGAVAWFIKKEITNFSGRLDRHEEIIIGLVGDVQRLIGLTHNWNGENEKRRHPRN